MKMILCCLNNRHTRSIGTTLLIAFVAVASFMPLLAVGAQEKQEPLDLSIIDDQSILVPYMNPSQRLELVRLEEAIDQAESDLRSGQFMTEVEPSPMQPTRDVKAINEEGKRLIAEAESTLYKSRKALIQLLETIDEMRKIAETVDETIFDLELEVVSYAEGLQGACQQIFDSSWRKGYEALFYHEVFIRDADGLRRAGSDVRNQVYDTLVDIDGTNFTLTLPVDFKLKADTSDQASAIFDYENASAFEKDKKALLAIEIMIPNDSSSALLSVRAIDMATQQIAAAELVKVDDITGLLDLENAEALSDQTLQRIELRGGTEIIERVASIPEPYRFEVASAIEGNQVQALIAHTLLKNSGLSLVGSDFIKEAYGSTLPDSGDWRGEANAEIVINDADLGDVFALTMRVKETDRSVSAGTATVFTSAADPVVTAADSD
jgi:hypothetical protein